MNKRQGTLQTEHSRINPHNETTPRLFRRLYFLLDRFLCNYRREEKDSVWAKGTFEEKVGCTWPAKQQETWSPDMFGQE